MRRSRLRSEPRPRGEVSTRRQPISKASDAQQEKVAALVCVVTDCENRAPFATIDPAHICARAHGGCDDPLCVVPICRWHHRMYDERRLDLLPHLIDPVGTWVEEIQHALGHGHYNGDLLSLLQRLTGERYVPETVEPVG